MFAAVRKDIKATDSLALVSLEIMITFSFPSLNLDSTLKLGGASCVKTDAIVTRCGFLEWLPFEYFRFSVNERPLSRTTTR